MLIVYHVRVDTIIQAQITLVLHALPLAKLAKLQETQIVNPALLDFIQMDQFVEIVRNYHIALNVQTQQFVQNVIAPIM